MLVYERHHDGRGFRVLLNLGGQPRVVDGQPEGAHIRLSTRLDRVGEPIPGTIRLRADEGVVIGLQ